MTTSAQSLERRRRGFRVLADLSLRIKLILVFLVVTLLAVGIIALLNIRSTSTALTTQVSEGLAGLAGSEGHNIGAILARHVTSLQSFALNPEVQAAIEAQNNAYVGGTGAILAKLTELDKQWIAAEDDDLLIQERLTSPLATDLAMVKLVDVDVAEVFATDRYGGLAATSDRTSDYFQADEGWWQAAYNDGGGAVFIASPELDDSTGVIAIDVAVPVYAQNNEVIGIIRTTLDFTALLDRLGHVTVGETGAADLFLEGEVFKAHHTEHEAGEGDELHKLDPVALAQITTAPEGYVETLFDGKPSLVGYAAVESLTGEEYVSDLGWKVLVHQAQSEALATVTAQTRNTLLLVLLVAGITAVVAVAMGQVLAGPIARLTSVVTRFTEGDLSARVDIDSRDETGVLAASFNQMAKQVGTLLIDLQARSAELEERTRELEASQSVTFAASERTSPDELLGLVVDLVRDQFDLYHAQMYMLDEEKQMAVLCESTGYAGSQLLQGGHQIPLDQTALVTKAIREKEPVLVDDTSQDPNFMPNPLLPETRTELVVPLRIGERVLGVLDIQDRTPGRFLESTIALFQAMADQVAFLFENNELLGRVTDQTEALTVFTTQLRTASDIAEQLSTILDPEQMLHKMAELMQSRYGLYHVHIYVLDEAKRKLVVRAGSGEVGLVLRERGHSIPLDAEKSLVARAARSGEPVLINDTSVESDFMPNPLLPQTRSELSVPLVVGELVLGVLDIQDDQADRFADSDVDTFSTLAGLAASSLRNAALFRQVEASAQETQVRFEISQALVDAQTEEEVLDVLIQQMGVYSKTRPAIFTVASEAKELTVIVRRQATLDSGLPPLEEGMRLAVSRFPSLQDSADGKSFMSSNLLVDEHVDPAVREIARMTGALSELSLPLMAGGEYLGVVSVSSPKEGYFDEHKQHLYQALAEQGATALQAARLRDKARESEAHYRGLIESQRDLVVRVDPQGRFTFVNNAYCQMFGKKREELIGSTFMPLVHPDDVEATAKAMKDLESPPYRVYLEQRAMAVDGWRWLSWEDYAIRDEKGNIVEIQGVGRDITDRMQAVESLRESEERFRGLYEASPLGIILNDYEKGDYLEANQAFLDMIGYSIQELNQLSFWDLTPKKYESNETEQFRSMEKTGRYGPYEKEYIRKDGIHIPVMLNGVSVTDGKGRKLIWSTVADITYRVQREEALPKSVE